MPQYEGHVIFQFFLVLDFKLKHELFLRIANGTKFSTEYNCILLVAEELMQKCGRDELSFSSFESNKLIEIKCCF